MYTVDEIEMQAPLVACFRAGADVERWPERLPHYRWVHFQRREKFGTGRVEMAARRYFGPLAYPVWWVSEMWLNEDQPAVLYRHVDGITRGMSVEWSFTELGGGTTLVRIVHDWPQGPSWPLPRLGRGLIADRIIGPIFIHNVATRTLRGIKSYVETSAASGAPEAPRRA